MYQPTSVFTLTAPHETEFSSPTMPLVWDGLGRNVNLENPSVSPPLIVSADQKNHIAGGSWHVLTLPLAEEELRKALGKLLNAKPTRTGQLLLKFGHVTVRGSRLSLTNRSSTVGHRTNLFLPFHLE